MIGNSDYRDNNSLIAPSNDLIKMENTLNRNYFGVDNKPFSSIVKKENLTKYEMINSIKDAFKDAKSEDISYFYYSGHGSFDFSNNTSYLVGVDGLGLSVHELESELRNIPGTIVIILDSCHSGGFINKGHQLDSIDDFTDVDYIAEYNSSIIDIFAQKKSRSFLNDNKYKVITAASKYEYSYELGYTDGWGWGGEFTRAFVTGNGYNSKFLADGNYDNNVTLQEIYDYTESKVNKSNVQVWPLVDSFIVGSDFKSNSGQDVIVWNTFKDMPLNKIWNIKFNMELDGESWKDNIYILDSYKNVFPTSISKTYDGKGVSVDPINNYDYNAPYTIVIEDNILSQNGNKLKNKVLVYFFTEDMPVDDKYTCLDIVQNGYFFNYPYPSVQIAFENFFGNPSWEYFLSTDNEHVVEFNGDAFKNGVPGTVTIQFLINIEDESFSVNYAAFDNEPMAYEEFDGLLNAIYDHYFNPKTDLDIEGIFLDNEDSFLLDNYIK